jgi:Tfp pilus assembly protein PilO
LELEPQPATHHDRVAQVPVTFNCRGTHAQLLGLLADLEQLPRIIWVEELKVARVAADAQAVQCELVLGVFGDKSEKTD